MMTGLAKTTFRSVFALNLIFILFFFKYSFFGFEPQQRRFCDEFGIQNRSPGEKILKIDKKPAILRFFNFYQFERLLKAMKDKIIFGFYFFLLFSRYISTN